LDGDPNFNVWKLKMWAILKAKNMWVIYETKTLTTAFPCVINGQQYTESLFLMLKAKAIECLMLVVKDDLVDIIVEHEDPADAWQALHDQF
jgi:hypothetical protein